MTTYYGFYQWAVYTTEQTWDVQPYPDEWANRRTIIHKSRPLTWIHDRSIDGRHRNRE
jgi:hypothetical protein